MRTKQILAALALPVLFAACTQDEFTSVENGAKVDLSNRPVLFDLDLTFGEGNANTRLGIADGKEYAAQWDATDGVGACIIDAPTYSSYPTAAQIAQNGILSYYDVKEYISSNYQYVLNADGKWSTQALLVEGNYMFYAPYNSKFVTRMPIVVTLPTEQTVDPAEKSALEVLNGAVNEFYNSGNPVFVGYQFLAAEGQSLTPSIDFKHIFAYPKITLKNDYTNDEKVAEDLTITKIEFSLSTGKKFTKQASVSNQGLADKLGNDEDENDWITKDIETAATSQILNAATDDAEKITVNFGEGVTIKAGASQAFYLVLPAEDYRTDRLQAEVYTADGKVFAAPIVMNGFVMNPGKIYPSEEYNTTSHTLKDSKGTLATISLKGVLVDVTQKTTGIRNNEQLINYISNVAKRFDVIKEVTDEFVANNTLAEEDFNVTSHKDYYYQYNPQLHFTLANDAEIVINDELIDALIDALGDYSINNEQTEPELVFLASSADKIKIGNLTKFGKFAIKFSGKVGGPYTDQTTKFTYNTWIGTAASVSAFEISGDVTLSGDAFAAWTKVTVPAGSKLTLAKDLNAPNLVIVNAGGTIDYEGGIIASITNGNSADGNTTGELNVNASTDINITNDGTLNVKGGSVNDIVTLGGVITNNEDAVINNAGLITGNSNVNNGTINVTAANGATAINEGTGVVVNDKLGAVTVATSAAQDVVANLTAVPSAALSTKANVNHVIFTTTTELTIDSKAIIALSGVTKIEFNGNIVTPTDLTLTSVTFVFHNTCYWGGATDAIPTVEVGIVEVKAGKTVTLNYINVETTETGEGTIVLGNNAQLN